MDKIFRISTDDLTRLMPTDEMWETLIEKGIADGNCLICNDCGNTVEDVYIEASFDYWKGDVAEVAKKVFKGFVTGKAERPSQGRFDKNMSQKTLDNYQRSYEHSHAPLCGDCFAVQHSYTLDERNIKDEELASYHDICNREIEVKLEVA